MALKPDQQKTVNYMISFALLFLVESCKLKCIALDRENTILPFVYKKIEKRLIALIKIKIKIKISFYA